MKPRYSINMILLLCIILIGGCKEDYVYPEVLTEFTDMRSNADGRLVEIICDSGSKYAISNGEGLDGFTPDSIYRTLSIFEPDGESEAKLYSCQLALAMKPQPVSNFKDGVKTDPLDIQRIWRSGNYINMILTIQGKDHPHTIHFVDEGIENGTLCLTIFHDQKDDYMAYGKDVPISIPLWPYEGILNKGDKIRININTFKEGRTFRELEF